MQPTQYLGQKSSFEGSLLGPFQAAHHHKLVVQALYLAVLQNQIIDPLFGVAVVHKTPQGDLPGLAGFHLNVCKRGCPMPLMI